MNLMKRFFRIARFLLLAAVLVGGTMTLASYREKTVAAQQTTLQRIQQRGVLLFTHSEIGVLMRRGQDDLLRFVNQVIAQMKADGSLRALREKYGL